MPESPTSLTDAELALLSLLAEQPMHGYQIEQTIEARGMREWTPIGFSSIYYLLDKMKAKGWLSSTLSQAAGKGPARQVFQITSSGKKVWKEAVLQALGNPHRAASNFMLGLANIIALDRAEVYQAVSGYRTQLQEHRAHVQAKLDGYHSQLPWEVSQLFDLSLAQITCELEWVNAFLKKLEEQAK